MNPINHSRQDALLTSEFNLPGAGKSVNSATIDIGQKGGIDTASLWFVVPALPNLAATKKIVVKLQSSADGETFADVPGAQTLTITGPEAGGSSAQELVVRVPFSAERYLRAVATADAASGDVTASVMSFSVRV